jgi:HAD superfamily hydrolase (TIGR01509 family)
MPEFQVDTPWQAFVQVRLRFYDEMLADPDLLRDNQWPHAVELLRQARALGCKTALATMSGCQHAQHVLDALGLSDAFDLVMTRDDVEHGKPDPEIYQGIARELGVSVTECLVIEDSPAGVKAALAAGMPVIAVATPFTQAHLHESGLLAENRIVDDPAHLLERVRDVFTQIATKEGSSITEASPT